MADCNQTYETADQDSYHEAMGQVLGLVGQPSCMSASLSGWAVTLGGGGAFSADASSGCETLSATFANTTNSIINSTCQMSKSINSKTLSANATQTIRVKISFENVAGDINIEPIQEQSWSLDSSSSISTDETNMFIEELVQAVDSDLTSVASANRSGVGSSAAAKNISSINTVSETVRNDTLLQERVNEIVNSVFVSQEQVFELTIKNVGANVNFKPTQSQVVQLVINDAIGTVLSAYKDTLLKSEAASSVYVEAKSESEGLNPFSSLEDITGAIASSIWVWVVLGIVVLAGGGILVWKFSPSSLKALSPGAQPPGQPTQPDQPNPNPTKQT